MEVVEYSKMRFLNKMQKIIKISGKDLYITCSNLSYKIECIEKLCCPENDSFSLLE